ncbi:hypothetical protein ACFWBH_24990 [Streptomyces sp. NPDC059999]
MDELPHGDAFFLTSFELWTRRAPVRPRVLAFENSTGEGAV